jgi:hypothetical protein
MIGRPRNLAGRQGSGQRALKPIKLDDLAENEKTPLGLFRAQRKTPERIERFLVAVLLERTEIEFLRDHQTCVIPFRPGFL